MALPIDKLIETLTETRAKLEEELGRVEAYRALRQLEQREASGEPLRIVPGDRLREMLQAELAGNHYLNARHKLDEALELLGTWSERPVVPAPPVSAAAGDNVEPAPPPPLPTSLQNEDLTLIQDLPAACTSVVIAAGFGRYKALASIDSKGVAMLERLLGQKGIVSRGNWIEQAAMLALGRETRFASHLLARRHGTVWPPLPIEPDLLAPAAPRAVAVTVPLVAAGSIPISAKSPLEITMAESRLVPPHDLTHIAGIDQALADHLGELGVTEFRAISTWASKDVDLVSKALGIDRSRIAAEGWIEQAAMLASGCVTRFLDRKPLRLALAADPPRLDIPLDADVLLPEAAVAGVRSAEETPIELEPSRPALQPILVDMPANDDPPPPAAPDVGEEAPASQFWPAAAGKAAMLRPPRRLSDRTDSAFDDVAALVARTVATARNVGGMTERTKRPAPPPASVRAEQVTADMPLRPAPAGSQRPLEARPGGEAHDQISIRPALPCGSSQAVAGFEPEASIEIRPWAIGSPRGGGLPKARDLNEPPLPGGGQARTNAATVSPRAPGAPRVPLAAKAHRPDTNGNANGQNRKTIVIDELAGDRQLHAGNGQTARSVSAPDVLPARLAGLVGRFVKALRGDKVG